MVISEGVSQDILDSTSNMWCGPTLDEIVMSTQIPSCNADITCCRRRTLCHKAIIVHLIGPRGVISSKKYEPRMKGLVN